MFRMHINYRYNHKEAEGYHNIDIDCSHEDIEEQVNIILSDYTDSIINLEKHEYFRVWVVELIPYDNGEEWKEYKTHYKFKAIGEL